MERGRGTVERGRGTWNVESGNAERGGTRKKKKRLDLSRARYEGVTEGLIDFFPIILNL